MMMMNRRLSEISSSPFPSSSSWIPCSTPCSSSSLPISSAITVLVDQEQAPPSSSRVSVTIDREGNKKYVHCKWKLHNFTSNDSIHEIRAHCSNLFEIKGLKCRFLAYPKGDSKSIPGYCSIYLQIIMNDKKDCFVSYRLSIVNQLDESRSIWKDSCHRFMRKNESHGWCDFGLISRIVDPKLGFISTDGDDFVVITADILFLQESISFSRENNNEFELSPVIGGRPLYSFLDGRFTWKIFNFSLFKEKIKTQKIMSPFFYNKNCSVSMSVYESNVDGIEYLSMCLESMKQICRSDPDKSCWCVFRISVKTRKPGVNHLHRDLYGRLALDSRSRDNASLGWNAFMKMSDFINPNLSFLVKDTAVFSASVQIIRESYNFENIGGSLGERSMGGGQTSDGYIGKFTWTIHEFTRLINISKCRNLFGLCVKSKKFQIDGRDCRLLVYPCPSGHSEPQCHLSLFLEVTDSQNTASDWSCFVCHRLSVVNQYMEDRSIVKESQNRYSKDAKDWGWRDFVTFSSLYDHHAGLLVEDSVVFSAEVLILKETSEMKDFSGQDMEFSNASGQTEVVGGEERLFAGPLAVFYNPQAAPIQSPPEFIYPNAHVIGNSFARPRPVMYNPQAAPNQLPQALMHPTAHLAAPIQSPPAFIYPNAHLAPIQSPSEFIHPNAHLAAPIQSPQAFILPNEHPRGQPMIMDRHPRYRPGYPHIRPYQGREF